MKGVEDLRSMVQNREYMISIDLSDAFFSIPLHPDYRQYVTFEYEGCRYSFNVLPFGLTSSPRIFYKVLKPVIIHLRSHGIKISAYMDDLFLCSHSRLQLIEQREVTMPLFTRVLSQSAKVTLRSVSSISASGHL